MINRHRPLLTYWDWQQHALCRGMDSAVFFSPHGERGAEKQAREEKARQVCRRCSVLEACAWTALSSREPYGVWGALSEGERRTLQQAPRPSAVTPLLRRDAVDDELTEGVDESGEDMAAPRPALGRGREVREAG
ncbi:WhiB family transcriptional regulator [Streptomyces sp. NPDC051954]|uniref:WhiB family transcriptional regulator n=1 Tax=unclassified Streptomyces TaxID=2593676 RepID=UPI00343FB344